MIADVCLLLEGTYPYVAGGVASWVHQLIGDLTTVKFALVHIGASEEAERLLKYPLPRNVVELREVFLHEPLPRPRRMPKPVLGPRDWAVLRDFHAGLASGDYSAFGSLVCEVFSPGRVPLVELAYGLEAWDFLLEQYGRRGEGPSFIDYFWTWRFTHLPLVRALSARVPEARCYHAVSTGYAGVMAAAARLRRPSAMLLTEHGIYTRERRLEIAHAGWIPDAGEDDLALSDREGFFRAWWERLFSALSRIAYRTADRITTIYEGNRLMQVAEGADPARIRVIPNGVEVEAYAGLRPSDLPGDQPVIALVGRVVPIKDVKTFIRAAAEVHRVRPEARIWVLGPTEEDPEYYADCLALVRTLELEEVVEFRGKVDLKQALAEVDLLVLTSISEGQPLVILEAMAAGIPCVATDVGACRELIEGVGPKDRALGSAGFVTPVGAPEPTAAALLQLLADAPRYQACARAARERVRRSYRASLVSARYQEIYEELPLLAELGAGVGRPESAEATWQA